MDLLDPLGREAFQRQQDGTDPAIHSAARRARFLVMHRIQPALTLRPPTGRESSVLFPRVAGALRPMPSDENGHKRKNENESNQVHQHHVA